VGLAGFASIKLLTPAFYALGDSRTPMVVSMASVLVNAAAAFTTVRLLGFGHAGLALSLSIVSWFNAITLAVILNARSGIDMKQLGIAALKIAAATAVMAGVCLPVVTVMRSPILKITIGVPVGALAFYAAALALRAPEATELRETVLRKLRAGS
jgi:putative peptidoglycan lipid II flippase